MPYELHHLIHHFRGHSLTSEESIYIMTTGEVICANNSEERTDLFGMDEDLHERTSNDLHIDRQFLKKSNQTGLVLVLLD